MLVNETMARTVWPGRSAIGGCVQAGHADDPMVTDPMAAAALLPCRTVVGVVRDSRARSLRTEGNEAKLMQYYVPFGQAPAAPFPNMPNVHGLLVRTAGDPERWVAPVQRHHPEHERAFRCTRACIRIRRSSTPSSDRGGSERRCSRRSVCLRSGSRPWACSRWCRIWSTQRTQEIGVRLALGGSGGRVARLVVRDAVRMASLGGVAGLAIALVAAPLVQSMLFETSAREPVILIAAAVVLLAVTVGAAAVPAWKAGRVSPMTVLRQDG